MAHVALAWLLAKPSITAPIIGARTLEQFTETVDAVNLTLSDEDVDALDRATAAF